MFPKSSMQKDREGQSMTNTLSRVSNSEEEWKMNIRKVLRYARAQTSSNRPLIGHGAYLAIN